MQCDLALEHKTDHHLIVFTPLECQLTFGNGFRHACKLSYVEKKKKQVAVSFFTEAGSHSDN